MSLISRHVFVVDDEVLITTSLSLILAREGFKVSPFTNPLEALEQFRVTPPDVLISDVMMPQLSGVELAKRAKRWWPACKILLFSAASPEMLRNAGADGHNFRLVQKPIHPEDLLEEIEQLDTVR